MADNTLEFTESDLAQMQRFNRKLAWLPRFRVRNRLTPRLIQALLRASQMLGANKPVKHGLQVQSTVGTRLQCPSESSAHKESPRVWYLITTVAAG